MKKLIVIIITLQLFILAILLDFHPFGESNIRTETGYIASTSENVTEILTVDGNVWKVENYIADPDSMLEVTFNTNGTEDLTDDTIINITAYTDF